MAIIESDNFAGRTVSNGWGTASNGHTWNLLLGAASSLSVGGSAGVVANSAATRVYASLSTTAYTDQEVLVRGTPGTNANDLGAGARLSLNAGNVSGYRYNYTISQLIGMKVVNGVTTQIATVARTLTAGTAYWFRLRVTGTNPTTITGRVWQDGTVEPSAWDFTFSDTSPVLSGAPGVTAFPANGASDAFDNFIAYDGLGGTGISSINLTENLPGSESITAVNVNLATVSEFLAGSEKVYTANGVYVVEKLLSSGAINVQNITTSAPTAPMQLGDLAIQYARIRAGFVNPYIKILATSLYGAGNNTNTSTITGALDAVLSTETIANSHTMRTTNDVKAFLQSYSYQDMVLQDNPAAYYRLGELSGTAALDSSMLNGAGTITGGVTLGQPGAITGNPSTSMLFDGSSGYITLPSAFTNGSTSFSIEFWVNLTNNTFTGYPCVIANDFPNTSHNGFQLILAPSTDGKAAYFTIGNGSSAFSASFGSGVLNASSWYHIVATYDGTTLKIYSNGALSGSASASGAIGAAANNISIARYPGDTGYLPASLEELGFYSYALPASKVLTHYNVGIGAV